jgi:hypothetical protein
VSDLADLAKWRELIDEYGQLDRLEKHTPSSRGQRFNDMIAELLRCWGVKANAGLRGRGEIDVAFEIGETHFVLEAKWEKAKTSTGPITKLQKRVRQRLAGTYGVFLSMSGYTREALDDVKDSERLEVFLLDRDHWEAMLSGLVPPLELFSLVRSRAAFFGDAHSSLVDLFQTSSPRSLTGFAASAQWVGDVASSAADGVKAEVLVSGIKSGQMGLCPEGEKILLTTESAILRFDPKTKDLEVAVPIPACRRNPVVTKDGSIFFLRQRGVGRFFGGKLTAVAGGVNDNANLVTRLDQTTWIFDGGNPFGAQSRPILTRIGDELTTQSSKKIDMAGGVAQTAAWISQEELVAIGSGGLFEISAQSGEATSHELPQSNPMGLVRFDSNTVLTAGGEVIVGCTDTETWEYHELAHLNLSASANEIALGPNGDIYVAAYYSGDLVFAVVRLRLRKGKLSFTHVVHKPKTIAPSGKTAAIQPGTTVVVKDPSKVKPAASPPQPDNSSVQVSSDSRIDPPTHATEPNSIERQRGSTVTQTRSPVSPVPLSTKQLPITGPAADYKRGHAEGVAVATDVPLYAYEGLVAVNFDLPRWLAPWQRHGELTIRGLAPSNGANLTWLRTLGRMLGSIAAPPSLLIESQFDPSRSYVLGVADGLRETWEAARRRYLFPADPQKRNDWLRQPDRRFPVMAARTLSGLTIGDLRRMATKRRVRTALSWVGRIVAWLAAVFMGFGTIAAIIATATNTWPDHSSGSVVFDNLCFEIPFATLTVFIIIDSRRMIKRFLASPSPVVWPPPAAPVAFRHAN